MFSNTVNSNIKTGPGRASFLFVLFVLFVLTALSACGSRPAAKGITLAGAALGTTYHITLLAPEGEVAPEQEQAFFQEILQEQIEALINRLDRSMSTYKPNSELNQLNRHPLDEAFPVSEDLLAVLVLAKHIYSLTEGAFDPSVGPLVDLWGFGPQQTGDRVPSASEIAALVEAVSFEHLRIDEAGQVTKTAEVELDLSAIAKGYVVDKIAELLADRGVKHFLVEVGGELRLSGSNPNAQRWKIAVEVPALEQGNIQRVLSLTDIGLATSGDYRNYFERDGIRYSHNIDPRNGYPVTHKLASITVLAPTAAEADALATGFMVLGKAKTLSIAERDGLAVFLLVKDAAGFKEYYTSHFEVYLAEGSNKRQGE